MGDRGCPSESRLRAMLLGDGEMGDLDEFAAHLEGCPRCERLALEVDARVDTLLAAILGDSSGLGRSRAAGGPSTPAEPSAEIDRTGFPTPTSPSPSGADLGVRALGPVDGRVGAVIAGRYELLGCVGQGGMGRVYLAQQREPVRRRVALKLIRGDLDARMARFAAERQALAMMDHPNIARVYDGGTTPEGQPYFVMEYVDGLPITQSCDERRLSPVARLELFVAACRAVEHAHQKGVIHRDLKPSNILVAEVDGRPTPKVIDFGVAKAIEQPLTEESLGDSRAIVGTPSYMAPEQAEPGTLDVDTRADIYSLGVVLYELLTGALPRDPYAHRRVGTPEILRTIYEQAPAPPSRKVGGRDAPAGVAERRGVDPARLRAWLRGDLDCIVMKALENDRDLRYATVGDLAADIGRFLADEPILARPPSRRDRLRKFARRHRGAVLAASLVILALVAGVVGTSLALVEARAQRARAIAEASEKEQANRQVFDALKLFTADLTSKLIGTRRELTELERSVLRNAEAQWAAFARSKGNSPEARTIRAEGAAQLAALQDRLGLARESEASIRDAIGLYAGLAADAPEVAEHRFHLARAQQFLGIKLRHTSRKPEGETNLARSAAILRELAARSPREARFRQALGQSLLRLGSTALDRDAYDEAEARYREAVAALGEDASGASDPAAGPLIRDSYWGLASTYRGLRDFPRAHREYLRALEQNRRLIERSPSEVSFRLTGATIAREAGVVLSDSGDHEAALAYLPDALATLRAVRDEFPSIPRYREQFARCLRDYAKVLGHLGRRDESSGRFREALSLFEQLSADEPANADHRLEVGLTCHYFANVLREGAAPLESLDLHRRAVLVLSGLHEADPKYSNARRGLYKARRDYARALLLAGDHREAISQCDRALELAPDGDRPLIRAVRARAIVHAGEADPALEDLAGLSAADAPGPDLPIELACAYSLASARTTVDAEALASKAIEQLRRAVEADAGVPPRLATLPDLDPIRSRADYRRLIADRDRPAPGVDPAPPR